MKISLNDIDAIRALRNKYLIGLIDGNVHLCHVATIREAHVFPNDWYGIALSLTADRLVRIPVSDLDNFSSFESKKLAVVAIGRINQSIEQL